MSAEMAAARVLVIDDDEGHAEALADGLEMDGYRCTVADSGSAFTDAATSDAA